MYIEKINGPADVKRLSAGELETLSEEVRGVLLKKLSEHGGHVGPNLGMVEATVALHYVFNSPADKIVYDVSHQSYAHKILTGRKAAFMDAAAYDEVSGYTEPSESEHDFFVIGHTSTSVSLATGLAKARDLKGGTGNVIAVIGDGSLSGGEAFEGLNNAAELGTNFIVIVNDNQMSIAENHGGLYRNLQLLRETDGQAPCNFFTAMGLDYLYVKDGNNVQALIDAFRKVKDIDHPVAVHINTLKGKGYRLAEQQQERFHYSAPFCLETGSPAVGSGNEEDYGDLTARYLLQEMKKDRTVVGITAGTPTVFGFTPERREEAGRQFVDVGIAEEHAVTYAAGLARAGAKPVLGLYGVFMQRAYDQLWHDLCLNNLPAVILDFGSSVYGTSDATHLSFFDLALQGALPNLRCLAPTCREEYLAMLDWAIDQDSRPVVVRVPGNGVVSNPDFALDPKALAAEFALPRYDVVHEGSDVAILALGSFFSLGESLCDALSAPADGGPALDATLVNPRFATELDEAALDDLARSHRVVVTLEDGVLEGGWGEKVARYLGPTSVRVLCYGVRKGFPDRFDADELLAENGMTLEAITADIRAALS